MDYCIKPFLACIAIEVAGSALGTPMTPEAIRSSDHQGAQLINFTPSRAAVGLQGSKVQGLMADTSCLHPLGMACVA